MSSLGSGFVIDPSGLIVTNNHVIEGADEIIVNFTDGSKLKVTKILGHDPKTDLALLKVEPKKPLKAVDLRRFREDARGRLGDGDRQSVRPRAARVTVGIISATKRDINAGPYDDFLQTDAAINRGNSGGPLVQHGRPGDRREHGDHLADRRARSASASPSPRTARCR